MRSLEETARTPDHGVEGARRPAGSARRAVVAALVALLLGALMNAPSLAETATRQPFGWQRTVAVAATRPLEVVAEATRLDRLHAWLAEGIGGWLRPETVAGTHANPQTGGDLGATAAPPRGTVTEDPRPDGGTSGEREDTGSPRADEPPDDEQAPEEPGEDAGGEEPRRALGDTAPLRVWVTGDSQVESLGGPLDSALAGYLDAEVTTDPRYSTGLARPDYFDWPAYAAETVAATDPDVVVLMLGGNDDQDMRGGGGVVARADDAWEREYKARARELLDALATEGRDVVWVGLPRMQQADFDAAMREIDTLQREVSEEFDGVRHVPTLDLVSEDGAYSTYLDTGAGVERVRRSDGVHLTPAGGGLLSRERLAPLIAERWRPESVAGSEDGSG